MPPLRWQNEGANRAQLPVTFLGDFGYGDDATIERIVEDLPAGLVLADAWLTFKVNKTDADPGLLQLRIDTGLTAQGQIVDTGAVDGVGRIRFFLTPAQTILLAAAVYYDIQVALNSGGTYTYEMGRAEALRPAINTAVGTRNTKGRVRHTFGDPFNRVRFPLRNEIIDDLTAGDDFVVNRKIDNIPAGETIQSARLTVRATPLDADPGLFQLSTAVGEEGAIIDAGADGEGEVEFYLTRPQTTQVTTPRALDIEVTLTPSGKKYTVLYGTIFSALGVTAQAGVLIDHITVTPDPFSVNKGATVQLTAEAFDEDDDPIPGVNFAWATSDPLVATVSAAGLVTGVEGGPVIITATAGGVEGEADGTVHILATLLPGQAALALVWHPNDGTDQLEIDSKEGHDAQFGSTAGADSDDPAREPANRLISFILDQMFVNAPNGINFNTHMSFACVLQKNDGGDTSAQYIVSGISDGGPGRQFELAWSNDRILVGNSNGGITAPNPFPAGLHLVTFRSVAGFGRWQIHIDGVLAVEGNNGWNADATTGANPRMRLGFHPLLGGSVVNTKRGTFALWRDYELTDQDIADVRTVLRAIPEYAGLP